MPANEPCPAARTAGHDSPDSPTGARTARTGSPSLQGCVFGEGSCCRVFIFGFGKRFLLDSLLWVFALALGIPSLGLSSSVFTPQGFRLGLKFPAGFFPSHLAWTSPHCRVTVCSDMSDLQRRTITEASKGTADKAVQLTSPVLDLYNSQAQGLTGQDADLRQSLREATETQKIGCMNCKRFAKQLKRSQFM